MPTASSFSNNVASLRRDTAFDPAAYRPEHDPDGTRAHAFVTGVYDALRKEAGLSEGAAYGFLCALAELGTHDKQATFWGGAAALPGNAFNAMTIPVRSAVHGVQGFMHPGGNNPSFMDRLGGAQRGAMAPVAYDTGKLLPNMGQDAAHPLSPGENFAAYGNVADNVIKRPRAAFEGAAAASSSDNAANLTHKVVNGDYMGAAGDAWDAGLKDKVAPWLHDHMGGFGDFLGQHLDTEHLKAMAPQVMAGLGTFAAGKLMGMGTGTAAALGVAGGYGLPKMYNGLSSLGGPHVGGTAAASVTPNVPVQPAIAPAKTQTQVRMDQSQQSANQLAERARQ